MTVTLNVIQMEPTTPSLTEPERSCLGPAKTTTASATAIRASKSSSSPPPHTADANLTELIQDVAHRDSAAWSELVGRYEGIVRAVAQRHGLTEDDVADVCQATWIRLVEHSDSLTHAARLAPWLVAAARSESLRILIGLRRDREAETSLAALTEKSAGLPQATTVTSSGDTDRERLVREAIVDLPACVRSVLWLLIHEAGMSSTEVAARLGLTPRCVGRLRNHALQLLRDDPRLRAARQSGRRAARMNSVGDDGLEPARSPHTRGAGPSGGRHEAAAARLWSGDRSAGNFT